jgi:hypothetical protein
MLSPAFAIWTFPVGTLWTRQRQSLDLIGATQFRYSFAPACRQGLFRRNSGVSKIFRRSRRATAFVLDESFVETIWHRVRIRRRWARGSRKIMRASENGRSPAPHPIFADLDERLKFEKKIAAALHAINQPNVSYGWDENSLPPAFECDNYRIVEQARGRHRDGEYVRWQILKYEAGLKGTRETPADHRHLVYVTSANDAATSLVSRIARDSIEKIVLLVDEIEDDEIELVAAE